jgi:hypothetical protein
MAIVYIPPELGIKRPMACAICGVVLALQNATAGLIDTNNQQAFACVSHFAEVERLIVGWADFAAHQRQAFQERMLGQGGPHYDSAHGGHNAH